MKLATAAYPLDPLTSWADYAAKIDSWVADAAGQGAELLVFPEYGAMELAMLSGAEAAGDLERSLHAVSDRIRDADDLHADLAAKYGVHILAASAPVFDDGIGPRPVNRARLFAPTGGRGHQDKQIMTRFEREDWEVAPTARRFEAGTPNMLGIHGMDASLSLFEEVGMTQVAALLEQNLSMLAEGLQSIDGIDILSPADPDKRAGILTFRHPECTGDDLHRALTEHQVICSPRAGGIRLSPHFYTPEWVLERTIELIGQSIQQLK